MPKLGDKIKRNERKILKKKREKRKKKERKGEK